ncbi:MAG TPA: prephenate dehydrogenase [Ktedonobacteraceae bacterium]|nr:prephenate dehydrogenase [Ktedonobacteraceae bacterium]
MFNRVAIIGLGLIGGSIGLALHEAGAAKEVTGYDLGKGICDLARKMGAIDRCSSTLADAVCGAELVILATPVRVIHSLMRDIVPVLSPETVVTDVASTKAQVISWAEELLPSSVTFVGGHPMAGKEVCGVEAAEASLFHDRIYCLTPTPRTPPAAARKVCALVDTLGAHVRFLEAAEHDRLVAGVSHLPFLASVALMNTVAEDSAWQEAALLAASGFRDASRLAAGSPEMYRDICLTNSTAIAQQLDEYIAHLRILRERIAAHEKDIHEIFSKAQHLRLEWQASQEGRVQPVD